MNGISLVNIYSVIGIIFQVAKGAHQHEIIMIYTLFVADPTECASLRAELYNLGIPTLPIELSMTNGLLPSDKIVIAEKLIPILTEESLPIEAELIFSWDKEKLGGILPRTGKLFFDSENAVLWNRRMYFTKAELMIVKTLLLERGEPIVAEALAQASYTKRSATSVHISRINSAAFAVCGMKLIKSRPECGYFMSDSFI